MEMKISFRFDYCQKEARILILYVGGIVLAKWKECVFLSPFVLDDKKWCSSPMCM